MISPRAWLKSALTSTLLLGASAVAAQALAPNETIELNIRKAVTLSFDADIGTALIADPETADVEVLDLRNVFLLGLAPNITNLKVYDKKGNLLGAYAVHVSAQHEQAQAVVHQIAGADSPIKVKAVGNTLFVSGEAANPSQAERVLRGIQAVVGDQPIVDALTLKAQVQVNLEVVISEVSRNITQELGINWGVDINPFADPLRTLVTGMRMATGPLRVQPTYQQNLQFRQVRPDGTPTESNLQSNELGVTLPSRGGDGRLVLAHYETFNSEQYRLTTFLEALSQNGLAVVHARPNLTVVSGESAQFNSGLEIPVPTATQFGLIGTEYQETGVNLQFTPVVLSENQISLNVQPRIREVTTGGANIGGTNVPSINQRSVSTTVELGNGQSIAIAGLYRRNTTSVNTGVPLVKDIPVWGALFRTMRETTRSVELIIVVTPHIVAPLGTSLASAEESQNPADPVNRLDNEFYF